MSSTCCSRSTQMQMQGLAYAQCCHGVIMLISITVEAKHTKHHQSFATPATELYLKKKIFLADSAADRRF